MVQSVCLLPLHRKHINSTSLIVPCAAVFACDVMSCFHPLTAYRAPPGMHLSRSNLGGISFDPRCADIPEVEVLSLPCGQCIGCRMERSRQWAMRIVLEQKFHPMSTFITLTYDDDHLPCNVSLCQEDMTLFLKRLRKSVDQDYGIKLRYFYCGEYGGRTKRPHYHLCLFGYDFHDTRTLYKFTQTGTLWKSEYLEKLWQKGYCPFGDLTFDSAAYTARYILKKVNGDLAADHYGDRKPEFICMSRRPGIGSNFMDVFENDIYSKDYIVLRNGIRARPPRYFDRLFKANHDFCSSDPDDEVKRFIAHKKRRVEYAKNNLDNSPDRLRQKEEKMRLLTETFYKQRKV